MDISLDWLDTLQRLAAVESVRLEDLGPRALEDLVARGLVARESRPRQASLERRYEALQETHHQLLEARACAERLRLRKAPKSWLAGVLPLGSPPRPEGPDPDAVRLLELLDLLRLKVRGVSGPGDVAPRLERILEHLQVEAREGLDRLAETDREIDQLHKQQPAGTLVEPEGCFVLTPAGESSLPEAPVVEAFETVLQTAFGPLAHQGPAAAHLKADPVGMLAFFLEGAARGERPSALLGDYEALADAFDRIPGYASARSARARLAFLVRLVRATRDDPRRAYAWCHRERLAGVLDRLRPLLPASIVASGWHLPYAADLLLADGGPGDPEQGEVRERIFEAVHRIQADLLQHSRIGDGAFLRLTLVLTHAARVRNYAPGLLLDRFTRQAFGALSEAAQAAPYDLGDRGTQLLFGAHLAHAAGWNRGRLEGPVARFAALHARFRDGGGPVRLPFQVLLHLQATLDRLDHLEACVPLEVYGGLLARLLKRLRHHKALGRILRASQVLDGDEETLAANLAARVCFLGLPIPPAARPPADVGLAGLYEPRTPGTPPVLGAPFGTLMLA